MKAAYTITPYGDNHPTQPLSLRVVLRKQARLMSQAGRWRMFHLRQPHKDWGPGRTYAENLDRSKTLLTVADEGFRLVVGYSDAGRILPLSKTAKIIDYPEPADIYATPAIQRIYSATFSQFDFVFNNGLYVNKPLLHGTRPPDAWDAGVHYSTSPQAHSRVMQVFDYWHEEAAKYHQTKGASGLPINGAIGMEYVFGPYASTSGNLEVRTYSGSPHVTHGHISGEPLPPGHGGEI